MDKAKLLGLLGIARKARLLVPGSDKAREAAGSKHAKLAVLSADASDNSKKRVFDFCKYYDIPLATPDITSSELGHSIGMGNTAVVVVTDNGLADAIKKITGVHQW